MLFWAPSTNKRTMTKAHRRRSCKLPVPTCSVDQLDAVLVGSLTRKLTRTWIRYVSTLLRHLLLVALKATIRLTQPSHRVSIIPWSPMWKNCWWFQHSCCKTSISQRIGWDIKLFQKFCPFLWIYFKLYYLNEYLFNLIEIGAIRISALLPT